MMKALRMKAMTMTTMMMMTAMRVVDAQDISTMAPEANRLIDVLTVTEPTQNGMKGSLFAATTEFCDTFGHRQVGTANLENSIDWVFERLQADGFSNVRKEAATVKVWRRGEESCTLLEPTIGEQPSYDVAMLGLGGSVGGDVTAPVLVIDSWDELETAARYGGVQGKIVVFNQEWTGYQSTGIYRSMGPSIAQKAGAVGVLVKSLASFSLKSPHTGGTRYMTSIPSNLGLPPGLTGSVSGDPIPAAAISVEDAELFARMRDRGTPMTIRLQMGAESLPDATSYNTVAEIRGSEFPNEIVMFSGHLDSWDVGQGAMDDAGPAFTAWQALRAIKRLGLVPRRTIRLILWTSEEIGGGASTYYSYGSANFRELDDYSLAMELDSGVWDPRGLRFVGNQAAADIMRQIAGLLDPIDAGRLLLPAALGSSVQRAHFDVQSNYGQSCGNCIGADVSTPLEQGVPGASILFETNNVFLGPVDDEYDTPPPKFQGDYFFYHHTEADTVTLLDSDQMDRAAAVFAVTAYAVAMLDTKLPRGGGIALQPPEERALINSLISTGGGQCPVESEGLVADVLTPAQCAVVMSSFSTACPEPRDGWSTTTAAQYTCSDECARIFVTAYMQCRTTYLESIASQTQETQAAVLALVGSQGSPCRVAFRQLVENVMDTVAADPTCGPLYEACMDDAECTDDLQEAWGSTLVDSAETRFEARICRKSREFLRLYECADNMPIAGNAGNSGWHISDCWTPDELPPPICAAITGGIRTSCPEPYGGWSPATARSYQCSDTCARAIVGAFHYCGTTMGRALQANPENAESLYALLDNNPQGPCRETFANLIETGLQAVASGTCAHEYNVCMTSSWCRNNVRDAIGSNLQVPEAEAAFELGLCGMSPEYQQLYQCLDVGGSGPPWRMASCAAPDRLRYVQCQNLFNEIPAACPPPAGGGWSPAAAAVYQCSEDCATKLYTAYFECQSSWFNQVDRWDDNYKASLFALVKQAPQPGPCAAVFQAGVESRIAVVAQDPECGPLYSACVRDMECRRSIGEGIGAMGYRPSRILFESTACDRPVEYQELLECAYSMDTDALDSRLSEYRPWRRSQCLDSDILPPVFCNYMMDNINASCPSDGRPFTPENAATYDCSEDCARTLTTTWYYCQTSFYLRSKEWPTEGRMALRTLVSQDPPGPCTATFRGLVSARMMDIESDPQCGPIYDVCVADPWCLANLQDAVRALSNEYTVEGFEDHMCDARQSEKFRWLYECIDRKRDGPEAWTRAECAAPDVLKPGQCAVLIDRFSPDSTRPACTQPDGGWEAFDPADYSCTMECAASLVTVYNECQTSWWHYTDTWPQEARSTLMSMVSRDPEYPGPCAATFETALEDAFTAIREDATCGPKYWRCVSDYGCREEIRAGIAATFTPPAKLNFESDICDKSWRFQEFYECAESIRPDWQPQQDMPPVRRWTQSRCWDRDKVPPPICDAIFEETGAACAIGGEPWFGGDGVLTAESAAEYTCPLECGRAIQDAWNYCQTSFGTYTTTQMTPEQRTVWYTLIDWDEDNPGPCMATFRNYVRERVAEVASGPCRLAYNNCVSGQNKGWCTRNLGDAIRSLQSEYARPSWERQMCSTSRDFQWLYQCVREEDVASGLRVDQVETPWRAASCAPADKLTRVQCQNLIGPRGIAAACPAPVGGWTPEAARQYSCSEDCARMLFAAVNECPTSFSSFVDTWSRQAKFSLFLLMNRDSQNPGACVTTRREAVTSALAIVAADPDCGPKYNACFNDESCRENIGEGIAALGYPPSRVLFESTMCSRPVAYQELHECTSEKVAIFLGARETGDWSRAWRRVNCLVPDSLPPVFCNGMLDNLNVSCPTDPGFVFNAETAATYDCSADCARSLTTTWNYCQTSFYMRTQEWDQNGREFLRHLVAGAPDLPAEGYVGPCAAKQTELIESALAEVEADPQCGPIYDECVVDGWCLANMRKAIPALQSEYARPSFEEKMCDSDKSATFQRLYECVGRQRSGASAWTRAECAAPDILTPSQCSFILEAFEDGSTHPACSEPAGGWNVAAIYDGYECTDECANMLTTVFKYCQTSWFRLVMSNANGWDEEGRETLRAMVSQDPEYPGPCAQTRKEMVSNSFEMLRNDVVCAPKYWACMTDYDCRVELGEGIGAFLTPWTKTRYESDMCTRTWQMQELYQCFSDLRATDGPSRARAWKRERCLVPDKAAPPACNQIFDNLRLDCPDINTLTVEEAQAAECSDMCARTVVTAWSWCQTSYWQRIQSLSDERRAVVWTLINWDEDEPGPCTSTFFDLVGARMRELETGPCARAYNNCVGGQNRDQCLPDLREAIGALQTQNENARTIFEATMCQKSRDFQWLYSCARHADDTVPDAEAWSPSACSSPDLLSPVTCNGLITSFRDGSACPAPRSGSWTPQSASTYECTPGCAANLMTAFYECPSSFARLVDEFQREERIALFVITQGWGDFTSNQKGACTATLQDMLTTGIGMVRDDATCGPMFDECYADLHCRESISDGIRAGFNVHAIRAFQANLCSKTRAYQELYQCMAAMDWGTELPDNYTPWSRLKCVEEDKLEAEDCAALFAAVRPACPGTNFLDAMSAENYQCPVDCARALVTVTSQCQSTLVNQASGWTQDERDAFAVLVRGGPGSEDPPGPCERVFGPLVFQGFTQIANDAECGQYFDACVGRDDNWCRSNLREGTAASLAPASRAKFESRLCRDASPEYQDLYQCVAASGFAGDDVWTKEKCLSGEYDSGSSGWYFGPIGLIIGLTIGYYCARKSLSRQQGGAYRSVNESEVRNLIREYVDTSGITKVKKGDSDSMYEATP